ASGLLGRTEFTSLLLSRMSADRVLNYSLFLISVKVDPSYLLTPGDSARLQCKIKGSPEIQVTWFKNNKEIRESNTHRMSFVNSVAVLDILEMKVDDSGSYSCEAVNEVGSDSCTTEVGGEGECLLILLKFCVCLNSSLASNL
uniref:Ig-like domain-containing protein n=1 Tax=Calidris pygmaea TaxID=425635 RepID=A0A8C3KGI3_9CHAR